MLPSGPIGVVAVCVAAVCSYIYEEGCVKLRHMAMLYVKISQKGEKKDDRWIYGGDPMVLNSLLQKH